MGHVLFSALPIVTERETVDSLALAPVAVLPEFQNRGVGSQLIRTGLDLCRRQGHRIVIVLGHPTYYPRFGFSAALAKPLESPYAGDSFMALELVDGALQGIQGRVEYPPPFGGSSRAAGATTGSRESCMGRPRDPASSGAGQLP